MCFKGNFLGWVLALMSLACVQVAQAADDYSNYLRPFLADHCFKCHGDKKSKGKVNFEVLESRGQFLGKPDLIREMIEVIDANDMPPEEEPQLSESERRDLLKSLKASLVEATSESGPVKPGIRRLNRFQYNNVVRDLFQIDRDIFHLQEKLMIRHDDYLKKQSEIMPESVEASSSARIGETGGFRDVNPFPKDLRAAHGFDNQANQLSLSPLLLDSFLKLSVSILESPDFDAESVGIWNSFFEAPDWVSDSGDNPFDLILMEREIADRLSHFLDSAFRRPTDRATLNRYVDYTLGKIRQGMPFTQSMKKVASAILSSPKFLFRYSESEDGMGYSLVSDMAFFLWGSGPDEELMSLARGNRILNPDVLSETVDVMLKDPRIERFLDSFPSQWMQLENVLAVTPDPDNHRLFSLDKKNPASFQMLVEPLLLFDAVFIENRPVHEFIAPQFSYRSPFLNDWYQSRLKPEPIDEHAVRTANSAREKNLQSIQAEIREVESRIAMLRDHHKDPIAHGLIDVDLSPGQTQWEKSQLKLISENVVISPWHMIGPFKGENFNDAHEKAFIKESGVIDLESQNGDKKWELRESWVDGRVHTLEGSDSATYLHRTIYSVAGRSLELSLGSDDSYKLWLNGKLLSNRKISRGVAPDQDTLSVDLKPGDNSLLMKVVNAGGGYGFYFKADSIPLPAPIVKALKSSPEARSELDQQTIRAFYLTIAPELSNTRNKLDKKIADHNQLLNDWKNKYNAAPKPEPIEKHRLAARQLFEQQLVNKMKDRQYFRVPVKDPRYGGVITNAAILSMTSGPKRTHPIARGAWIIEVIFNDPPPPPPNDVPPLNEDASDENLTIREKFAVHRENPDCAGCHSRLDPLGFALENFDVVGRWRDKYENGRSVDAAGTLMKKYNFGGIVEFKNSLLHERRRFARAFTAHLLRFAMSRELTPRDSIIVEAIVNKTEADDFRIKSLIREVILSESFSGVSQ